MAEHEQRLRPRPLQPFLVRCGDHSFLLLEAAADQTTPLSAIDNMLLTETLKDASAVKHARFQLITRPLTEELTEN